jgi:hypothetical protein
MMPYTRLVPQASRFAVAEAKQLLESRDPRCRWEPTGRWAEWALQPGFPFADPYRDE